jgi:hypothetical protein
MARRESVDERRAVERHAPLLRLQQAEHHLRRRALARAGLADETKRLAARDREVDAVERLQLARGLQPAAADREAMADAGEFQQRRAHGAITQR